MKTTRKFFISLLSLLSISFSIFADDKIPSLKESLPKIFLIGTAMNPADTHTGKRCDLIKKHFSLIVAENSMKPQYVEPSRGKFNFSDTDKIIDFANENNLQARWHTLCWHSQTPNWMFTSKNGGKASKEEAMENLKTFIFTVMEHNKGKNIHSYDVVNECISDSTGNLRNGSEGSKWYEIIGPEYVDLAFTWAHQADPDAFLVINDYSLESNPKKREAMYKLVKGMKERGVPVDGIGLQMHIDITSPSADEIKQSIDYFAELGVKVLVTEMDMSCYKWEDKSPFMNKTAHDEAMTIQADRYKEIFTVYANEAKAGKLDMVVLWGIDDGNSWKNGFPVRGRTDYPLLFDYKLNPKPCFWSVIGKKAPKK